MKRGMQGKQGKSDKKWRIINKNSDLRRCEVKRQTKEEKVEKEDWLNSHDGADQHSKL